MQANRDAGIREAECEKAAMDIKYSTDTKIEDNSRAFKLQKANFDKEVNTAVSYHDQERLVFYDEFHFRKLRPNWPMSCKQPRSNRESGMRKYRFRLWREGSRSRLRIRRLRGRRRS